MLSTPWLAAGAVAVRFKQSIVGMKVVYKSNGTTLRARSEQKRTLAQ
ncbi:hypothetical protein [Piscirickettsia salmonis]|nr:hypothetical protein [Piscirickettsia salmonis]QHS25484.1 hypothetical protein GW538_05525 [Piscirickettsia salmonis]QHS28682.1 hypothetical protein GW537_05510 [Piscirickettsia salmonis]